MGGGCKDGKDFNNFYCVIDSLKGLPEMKSKIDRILMEILAKPPCGDVQFKLNL